MDRRSPHNICGPEEDTLDSTKPGGTQRQGKVYLYVAARNNVVSTTLVVERTEEGKVQSIQRPIYYLNMLLTKSQQWYPHYQKLLLAIIMTSRKVSHYFDEHPITIVRSAPLAYILNNPRATRRVAEWNIELSPRDLQFKHPKAIKAQVLPDILVEWTEVQTPAPPGLVELMGNVFRRVEK